MQLNRKQKKKEKLLPQLLKCDDLKMSLISSDQEKEKTILLD